MADLQYRFGPFLVDRARYRVLRGEAVLDLTPKLLDLLLYLLDHAGALVTKEQLLDALWPDANVTDNALAQAVSELRDALGDDAGTPKFIKTIARRGYRFIAPVDVVSPTPDTSHKIQRTAAPHVDDRGLAVMDFANVTGDPNSAWLSAGIAETVSGDLRAMTRFRVVDRGRVMEAIRETDGSVHQVAARLGTTFAVFGSYQTNADRIRITARIVDVESGEALADAKVDGPIADIFALQDQVVAQFSRELGFGTSSIKPGGTTRETASLEAYRAYTEAWLHLETLDIRAIPQAIAGFQRAITIDPGYALAFTGLASGELAAYETTRADTTPAVQLLNEAVEHARRAVALDATLAEAHATLAFVLVSAWRTTEAVQVARRAVALEPTNWRHYFRLGHAAWGEERIRAANDTLSLYPDFAFAHFQMAMVHVARGHLREAETVLRQGAAVQDRQVARGDRYPALGLHWLLGLVRLAQADFDEALKEFASEEQRADPQRLYGREYAMSAVHARGACLLRLGKHADAIDCFERSLEQYPEHAQSHIGLISALRATGSTARAQSISKKLQPIVRTLSASRPIEAAVVESQMMAADGRSEDAGAIVRTMLETAPPGFAGWTLRVEPLLSQLTGTPAFTAALRTLAERAR